MTFNLCVFRRKENIFVCMQLLAQAFGSAMFPFGQGVPGMPAGMAFPFGHQGAGAGPWGNFQFPADLIESMQHQVFG